MSALPPLFGVAPPLACSYWLGDRNCGKPGTWHIMWTEDLENGIACDEHFAEVRERWCYYAIHEYRPDCSMPGALYHRDENICVVDEGELGLAVAQAVSVA